MYLSNTALVLFFHANRILGNKSDPWCAIFLSTCLVSLNKQRSNIPGWRKEENSSTLF